MKNNSTSILQQRPCIVYLLGCALRFTKTPQDLIKDPGFKKILGHYNLSLNDISGVSLNGISKLASNNINLKKAFKDPEFKFYIIKFINYLSNLKIVKDNMLSFKLLLNITLMEVAWNRLEIPISFIFENLYLSQNPPEITNLREKDNQIKGYVKKLSDYLSIDAKTFELARKDIEAGNNDSTNLQTIKEAYKKFSLAHHPDKTTGNSQQKRSLAANFQEFGDTYELWRKACEPKVIKEDFANLEFEEVHDICCKYYAENCRADLNYATSSEAASLLNSRLLQMHYALDDDDIFLEEINNQLSIYSTNESAKKNSVRKYNNVDILRKCKLYILGFIASKTNDYNGLKNDIKFKGILNINNFKFSHFKEFLINSNFNTKQIICNKFNKDDFINFLSNLLDSGIIRKYLPKHELLFKTILIECHIDYSEYLVDVINFTYNLNDELKIHNELINFCEQFVQIVSHNATIQQKYQNLVIAIKNGVIKKNDFKVILKYVHESKNPIPLPQPVAVPESTEQAKTFTDEPKDKVEPNPNDAVGAEASSPDIKVSNDQPVQNSNIENASDSTQKPVDNSNDPISLPQPVAVLESSEQVERSTDEIKDKVEPNPNDAVVAEANSPGIEVSTDQPVQNSNIENADDSTQEPVDNSKDSKPFEPSINNFIPNVGIDSNATIDKTQELPDEYSQTQTFNNGNSLPNDPIKPNDSDIGICPTNTGRSIEETAKVYKVKSYISFYNGILSTLSMSSIISLYINYNLNNIELSNWDTIGTYVATNPIITLNTFLLSLSAGVFLTLVTAGCKYHIEHKKDECVTYANTLHNIYSDTPLLAVMDLLLISSTVYCLSHSKTNFPILSLCVGTLASKVLIADIGNNLGRV